MSRLADPSLRTAPSRKKAWEMIKKPVLYMTIIAGVLIGLSIMVPLLPYALALFESNSGQSNQASVSPATNSGRGVANSVPLTSSKCPGEPQIAEVSLTPVVVNPKALCSIQWKVDYGRVELIDTDGTVIQTAGPEPTHILRLFESIRGVNGQKARFRYQLTR